MNIQAIGFDLGQTLVFYDKPLNWQTAYSPAIKLVMAACGLSYTPEADKSSQNILTKYNTRVNLRDYEVSADTIFTEILSGWQIGLDKLTVAKTAFYSYFMQGAVCFSDAEHVLRNLKSREIKTGVLTDVPYGMDNEYALQDLAPVAKYIDKSLTSNDVGFRKPNIKGYLLLQEAFGVPCNKIAFVGDEEKDVVGANNAGFISVLVNRTGREKSWGQSHSIRELSELLHLID